MLFFEKGEKYKVIKEIYIYDCVYGHIGMGVGTVFEVFEERLSGSNVCVKNGKIGDIVFPVMILKYCDNYFKKIVNL